METYPPIAMPWYRSKVIIGALVSIFTKLLVLSGLTGEITASETAQIVDLVLILSGAVGDLVAIGARLRQRHVPKIVSTPSKASRAVVSAMFACLLVFPMMGCASVPDRIPSSPAAVADKETIDEQAALTLTLAYTGAARAAALAIETGLVDDPKVIARIGELDVAAFGAVKAAESAYRAGNADSYALALVEARAAVGALLSSVKGESL